MDVYFHPGAQAELDSLPAPARQAIDHAIEKLRALGAQLPFPHASNVEGAAALFELRPRAGRSQWSAFYRQVGAAMVVAAIGPKARADARGFARAVRVAQQPLSAIEGVE